MFHIGYQVDVSHDRNLESFLAVVRDNGEHETLIRVEKPLIEKRGDIKDDHIGISLDAGDYL